MKCPICKKAVPEPKPDEKSFYPFCSDRCKLVDLNRWFTGKYQIPVSEDENTDSEKPFATDNDE